MLMRLRRPAVRPLPRGVLLRRHRRLVDRRSSWQWWRSYYLARLDLPRRRAERAVLLTAIFPFAFFFGVIC